MVVTELVNNALLHGEPGLGDQIWLAVARHGNRLRIDVHDGGMFSADCNTFRPSQPSSNSDSRGLRIVQKLSTHWQAVDGRVTAWLEL